ncbi:MAG: hypothetical protein ACIAXF_10265 [Phycisphaerales bacterium JB063]
MPYVDEGEPKPRGNTPPIVPVLCAIAAAGLGAALWMVCLRVFNMSYPAGFLTGLAIGLALKLTLKQPAPPLRIVAIVLTVAACLAGFVWCDQYISVNWIPPSPRPISQSVSFFFSDITALLFTGLGAYIAFVLAVPKLSLAQSGDSRPQAH